MAGLGTRIHMAWLALVDPAALVAYQQGGRMLDRDEAERVAEIVIGQVSKPISGLYEEIAAATTAINELSATLVEAQNDRAAGFGRIYGLIESIVAEKENAHADIYRQLGELREAGRLLLDKQVDLERRVDDLVSEVRAQHERLTLIEGAVSPNFDAPGD